MPLFQKPAYLPLTVMDREAAKVLAIRVRVRQPAGGTSLHQFLKPGSTAGMRVNNGGNITGGGFGPTGGNENFA